MSELNNIQKWLTSIIVKPGALDEKITLADEFYGLDNNKIIRTTENLSAKQRIRIYANGYIQRLVECLEAEYPVLRHLVGEELFSTFARAYLMHFPSKTPDLHNLGQNFPGFLKASQPANRNGNDDRKTHYDLAVDLARVERAIAEVLTSEGMERKEEDTNSESVFFMLGARLHTPPCLRLLRTAYPLVKYVHEVQRGKEMSLPQQEDSYIALSRKNYAINMHELEPWQWHFLDHLQRTDDYAEAARTTTELSNISKDNLLADLMLWAPSAVGFGYIYAD